MDLTCDERDSDSPLVERIWYSESKEGGAFQSIAQQRCELVFSTIEGQTYATMRGPETYTTPAFSPPNATFFGITLKPGAYIPQFPAGKLIDRQDIHLPSATGKKFWLHGATWQIPTYENADTFIHWLVRDGLLHYDPIVKAVLQDQPVKMSLRTLQRRFLQVTGLTQGVFRQIEQARYAMGLLKQGHSILDTVYGAGYADQPHLTRSLKRFMGHTPIQIVQQHTRQPLSFLFNTDISPNSMIHNINSESRKEISA